MRRTLFPAARALCAAALCVFTTTAQAASEGAAREAYIEFCFNYGCEDSALVRFDADTVARAGELFAPVETPAEERIAIARAILVFYRIAGEQTPISADLAGNKQDEDVNGRMDCIDHTRTIQRLLALFEKRGWLRYHTIVEEPVHRRFFIFDHIAPALEERPVEAPAAADNLAAQTPAAPAPNAQTAANAADAGPPRSPKQTIERFNQRARLNGTHTHETRTGLREVRLPPATQPAATNTNATVKTPAAEPPQGGRSPLGGQRMTDARSAAGVSVGAVTPARYVVDGWLVDFGKEPIILPYEEWRNGGGPDVGY